MGNRMEVGWERIPPPPLSFAPYNPPVTLETALH
jgi:hypothetical protein